METLRRTAPETGFAGANTGKWRPCTCNTGFNRPLRPRDVGFMSRTLRHHFSFHGSSGFPGGYASYRGAASHGVIVIWMQVEPCSSADAQKRLRPRCRDKPCLSGLRSKQSPEGRSLAAGRESLFASGKRVRSERRTSKACPYIRFARRGKGRISQSRAPSK